MEIRNDISIYDLGATNWYVNVIHKHGLGINRYDLILMDEDETEEIKLVNLPPLVLKSLAKTCRLIASEIGSLHLEVQ